MVTSTKRRNLPPKIARDKSAEHLRNQEFHDARQLEINMQIETSLSLFIISQRATTHTLREAWLSAFVEGSRYLFELNGYKLPETIKISIGFPHIGARGKVMGECWSEEKYGEYQIFISPLLDGDLRLCDIVTHELVHAAVGLHHGHRRPFAACANALGLGGKMRSTIATDRWFSMHSELVEALGPLPHRKLILHEHAKKDGTRMLKLECPECQMVFRTAKKWITDAEFVYCPISSCGTEIPIVHEAVEDAAGSKRE